MALADKGPDEAVTVLWEALSAEKLAADDLEHRLAVVRATGHPSALSLAAAIADFVASDGVEKLSVNQCLQLKVSLARWKPLIWRTVLIPATANLAALHLVIQALYAGAATTCTPSGSAASRTATRRSHSSRPVMSTPCGC